MGRPTKSTSSIHICCFVCGSGRLQNAFLSSTTYLPGSQIYIQLHDNPGLVTECAPRESFGPKSTTILSIASVAKADAQKKARKKAKKAEKKAEGECPYPCPHVPINQSHQPSEFHAATNGLPTNDEKDIPPTAPKDDDPDGMKLLSATDPLEQAWRWIRPLEELRAENIQVWLTAYDISLRRSVFFVS